MVTYKAPRNVKISGLTMDVDRITHLLAHKDNNHEQWVNYNRASGARLSAMEHLVPEHKTAGAVLHSEAALWVNHMDVVNEMFSTDENPAHGISAVKAIQLAAAEGQKIWTITQANLNTALANIALDNDIKNDIRNAVYAGKEVTTHEKFVNFYSKTSAGYIILDPTTGAGAYMISSGEKGGDIDVPDLVSTVTGYASILLDIGLYAAGEASDIAGQASRFIMTAFSKLFSTVSTVLGIGSSTFSILENCPIEAIALVLPVFLFLTGLAIFLTAFILTGVGAILGGIIAGALVSAFSGAIIAACRRG